MADSLIEIIVVGERVSGSGPIGGYADAMSVIASDGLAPTQILTNGYFELWDDEGLRPIGWDGGWKESGQGMVLEGVYSLGLFATSGTFLYSRQTITVSDQGIPVTCEMDASVRSYTNTGRDVGARCSVYVRHVRTGNYLDPSGAWQASPIAVVVSDPDPAVWTAWTVNFNPLFGPTTPPPPPDDPPEPPIVPDPTAPGCLSALLAIAGLAVAGLARVGFYPNQTDDMVLPPSDPPAYDGGVYAYHDDTEGKE